jgi:hypothetical protein
MTRQDDNIRKRIKSTEKFVPFIRLQQVTGWDGRRYRRFAIVRVLPAVNSVYLLCRGTGLMLFGVPRYEEAAIMLDCETL